MKGCLAHGQDLHGVYICNDWDGYAFRELMENQVGCLGPQAAVKLTCVAPCHQQGCGQERRSSAVAAH